MQERDRGFVVLCFEKLLPLIVLNIFFLLTCLPVFTLPAGWTAMNRGCQELFLDHKGGGRKFWRSVRENFFASLLPGVIFLAGPMALFYGSLFYYRLSEGMGIFLILALSCFVSGYLLSCVGVFAFQMLAHVTLRSAALLKNAFYLTFCNHRIVLGWLLLSFALSAVIFLLFPYSLPWALLLGASLPCFISTRGVLPVIDTTIVKE